MEKPLQQLSIDGTMRLPSYILFFSTAYQPSSRRENVTIPFRGKQWTVVIVIPATQLGL